MKKRKRILRVFFLVILTCVMAAAGAVGVLFLILVWFENKPGRDPSAGMLPEMVSDYGTMDEEGVFHVCNDRDWLAFLRYVADGESELDAVLETDVTMKCGYIVSEYAGNLDGQGHRIEVSTGRRALFLKLEKGGVIENLTFEVEIKPIKTYGSGGIVNYNFGTIRDCEVYGTVTGYDYAGGIVENNLGLIEDCTNYAEVISLETGETWEYEGWEYGSSTNGYGAGGIAGFSGTAERRENMPETCAIINCRNYGDVTGEVYAGGIVAWLRDKTDGDAPASSVQELVQNNDFAVPSEDSSDISPERTSSGEDGAATGREESGWDQHYSLANCTNYGTVTVNQRTDPKTNWDTKPAGICAELSWGDLFRCVNRGKVQFAESAPKCREDGRPYKNRPMAITENMGFAPTEEHHIIECVNLKGTIEGTMRQENILELSEEELSAWEAGNYTQEYISNNWEFDLEEAVYICGLEPLGIKEKPESAGRSNYYLCEDFALLLPEYLEIEEVSLPEGEGSVCYALRISISDTIDEEALAEELPDLDRTEECYIFRKEADVQTALAKVREEELDREDWYVRYFTHSVYRTIPACYDLLISPLNLPFDDSYRVRYQDGKRIWLEGGIPDRDLRSYMKEGRHMLGNKIVMPLEGASAEDFSAKWLFFFTRSGTNIHPSREFVDLLETGFYPLEGTEELYMLKPGDKLWSVAKERTGSPGNWRMLAAFNGIEDPDTVYAGDTLLVPREDVWEKKVEKLTKAWLSSCGNEAAKE